jgi:hypothetical protein
MRSGGQEGLIVILAVDPGPTESAYCLLDDHGRPSDWATLPNAALLALLALPHDDETVLVVEMVASYGMPVGAEVFETCVVIGRLLERWGGAAGLVTRSDVKLHLTHQRRSKDANVRQALIDRFGPGKDRAIGRKATPGPLYGLTGDAWAALAVAVTAYDELADELLEGPRRVVLLA